MRQDNINYFIVGIFVIGIIALSASVLLYVSGNGNKTEVYYATYNNVTGLKKGTAVTFSGYQIGQVDKIKPFFDDGNLNYKLAFKVKEEWVIPKDSVARIVSPGLLSDPQIDITPSTHNVKLVPGDYLIGKEATNIFSALDAVAGEVQDLTTNNIKPLVTTLNDRVNGISEKIEDISIKLDEGIPDILSNVDQLVLSLNGSASQLNKLLSNNNQKHVSNIIENADVMSNNLVSASSHFQANITQLDRLLQSSQTVVDENGEDIRTTVINLRDSLAIVLKNIDEVVYNVNTSSRNLAEFSHQIRTNPSIILGSTPPKDLAEGRR